MRLPISTFSDESRPAFTPDGRYLGFVRHNASDGHDRLFVWDSQTQTLLNDAGADLGVTDVHDAGNVSLYVRSLILASNLSPAGLVTVQTVKPTGIGILVQRVVGHQKLLGRSAPKLQLVGRVPLGRFSKGRGHVRWDGRVNGRKLKRGTYQVTVRAVSPKGDVLDFGTPHTVKVR